VIQYERSNTGKVTPSEITTLSTIFIMYLAFQYDRSNTEKETSSEITTLRTIFIQYVPDDASVSSLTDPTSLTLVYFVLTKSC